MFFIVPKQIDPDWLVSVDLNCPIDELLRIKGTSLLYIYVCMYMVLLRQYMRSWKCCFSPQRAFPRAGPCGLAQVPPACLGWAQSGVRRKAGSVQQYVVRQEACSFLRKTSGPSSLEWNIFLCQSPITPADEMYQDFENPEHGKLVLSSGHSAPCSSIRENSVRFHKRNSSYGKLVWLQSPSQYAFHLEKAAGREAWE